MRNNIPQRASTLGLPTQMRQKFKDLNELAKFCFPEGSTIGCLTCQIERPCTVNEIAGWLENGFPFCKKCSHRVSLVNPWIKNK